MSGGSDNKRKVSGSDDDSYGHPVHTEPSSSSSSSTMGAAEYSPVAPRSSVRLSINTLISASRRVEEHEDEDQEPGENCSNTNTNNNNIISNNPIPMLPPDDSALSPLQKYLLVDMWSDNERVVEHALHAVGNLCTAPAPDGVAHRAAVHAFGAVAASMIACAMRKWYFAPSVQAQGCRVLAAAASTLGATESGFRAACLDAGALEAVAWALTHYPDAHAVQAYGCGALGNLCAIERNAAHVVRHLHGHVLIVAAMRTFPRGTDILRIACHALTNLSGLARLRTGMVGAGCRQALLEAMDSHKDEAQPHVKDMQKWARLALMNLL